MVFAFLDEYTKVVRDIINILWEEDDVPPFLPKKITSNVTTWLSARAIQCAGKQASGIVRGTKTKQQHRLWMIEQLRQSGNNTDADRLQAKHDSIKVSKPIVHQLDAELDSRFIKIDLDNDTVFDGWLNLSSMGGGIKIAVPFKKHRHFNRLLNKGRLKSGVRLSQDTITFMFDIDVEQKQHGGVIGVDVGQKSTISCSDGNQTTADLHGHTLQSINARMSRKQKGSKAFGRCVRHRTNYIGWSIKQLGLDHVHKIRIENIKNLRKCKHTNRRLSHWTYAEIFAKLKNYCEEQGVLVEAVNPAFTSQRCSHCGWTQKSNRNGSKFKCKQCGFIYDADLNASINIALDLCPIQTPWSREGFRWAERQESIVPAVSQSKI